MTAADLAKALRPKLDTAGMTAVGVGSVAVGDSVAYTVIVAKRHIALKPVPIAPAAAKALNIAGELDPSLTGSHVLMTDPDGRTRIVAEAKGRQLNALLPIGDAPGRYVVELIAMADDGPTLTDVLELHVGVPFPKPFVMAPPGDKPAVAGPKPPTPTTPEGQAEALLKSINELRMRGAIMPLTHHKKLAEIALYNSQELRRRRTSSPNTVLADIYVKNQVRYRAFKAAAFVTARPPRAQDLKLARSRFFTHIGIGLARGKLKNGKDVIWGTIILMAER